MLKLEQTWRWYGPNDTVSLQDIKQAGATGIVTALHQIPHGAVWPKEEILKRKKLIENSGLTWSVVESLPVHEDIKTRTGNYKELLQNYNTSLKNLAECGVHIVCYNFMPVLDWTRTQLDYELSNGAKALRYDWVDLVNFDIHILNRKGAKKDYSKNLLDAANRRFDSQTVHELKQITHNILMGIPGEGNINILSLRKSIEQYQSIGSDGLRDNLVFFLKNIEKTCIEYGIKMTIHPDDPPYPILGLPRVVHSKEDYQYLLQAVDSEFNGICFCTGSLGVGDAKSLPDLFEMVKERVYFVHLRNVKKDEHGNFYEADHLDGDVDMYTIMKTLVQENQKRKRAIPFRPDHGHQILDDLDKKTNPGYSAIGRLKGLAELRGLEMGIIHNS